MLRWLLPVLVPIGACAPECEEYEDYDFDEPTPAGLSASELLEETPSPATAQLHWNNHGERQCDDWGEIGAPTQIDIVFEYAGGDVQARAASDEDADDAADEEEYYDCPDTAALDVDVVATVRTADGRLAGERARGSLSRVGDTTSFSLDIPLDRMKGGLREAFDAAHPYGPVGWSALAVDGWIDAAGTPRGWIRAGCLTLATFPDCDLNTCAEAFDAVAHRWVHVFDTSWEENREGTAGADVCGVSAACGGERLVGVAVEPQRRAGVCTAASDECAADRGDERAALDDGFACDIASAPVSDYVSLGVAGSLAVDFGRDLAGCTVEVVESRGDMPAESYEVYLCEDADARYCLRGQPLATAPDGGTLLIAVPR